MSVIRMQRTRARAAIARPTNAARTASVASTMPLVIFCVAAVLPSELSLMLGGLNITAYRAVLIVAFVPSLLGAIARTNTKTVIIDSLVLACGLWVIVSLARNHGGSAAAESGGVYLLELLGPYLLCRAYLRTPAQLRRVIRTISILLCILAPLMLFESLTGIPIIKRVFGMALGKPFHPIPDTRFGLHRAYGSFDHPILAGVFTASAVALIWFSYGRASSLFHWKRGAFVGAAALASFASLSSGALGSMVIQFGLIAWERVLRRIHFKWAGLAVLSVMGYFFIDLLSNRNAYQVFISYLTMNPSTGYARLTILEWGFHHNVLREPLFGIGRNDWIRPEWMHSPSVDNFWLFTAMSYGIPAFLFLFLASVLTIVLGKNPSDEPSRSLKLGWMISMFALILAAITVHYWGNSFVWYSFMLGIGTLWLRPPAPARSGRRRRDRATRSSPPPPPSTPEVPHARN